MQNAIATGSQLLGRTAQSCRPNDLRVVSALNTSSAIHQSIVVITATYMSTSSDIYQPIQSVLPQLITHVIESHFKEALSVQAFDENGLDRNALQLFNKRALQQ